MPKKRLGPLGRLSCGERLLILRRRSKKSQKDASAKYDVNPFIYGRWERDVMLGPSTTHLPIRLKTHERCLLYRRRAEIAQRVIARELGRSRWHINKMERGVISCHELLCYWEK